MDADCSLSHRESILQELENKNRPITSSNPNCLPAATQNKGLVKYKKTKTIYKHFYVTKFLHDLSKVIHQIFSKN